LLTTIVRPESVTPRGVTELTIARVSPNVLRYTLEGEHRGTVRRHFIAWREQQTPPIPLRCDNPECIFHTQPLLWNNKPLDLILDHIDGNNSDNRPHMLRFLCPNCDSQLETRGGANARRIEKSSGGFAKVTKDGKRAYVLPCEPLEIKMTGGNVNFAVTPNPLLVNKDEQ